MQDALDSQSKNKIIKTLVNLGLTVLQAKVYCRLLELGSSTAKSLAKKTEISQQDIYRVLSGLQDKCLIEKVISKPNGYTPISLKKALMILFNKRHDETEEIENKIAEALDNYKYLNPINEESGNTDLIWIPKNNAISERLAKGAASAKKSLDLGSEFPCAVKSSQWSIVSIPECVKRGVRCRRLIDLSQGICKETDDFSRLNKSPYFETRYVNLRCPVKIQIKDRQEVLISLEASKSNTGTPYLWSNNKILVEVIQQWYDMMWEKGDQDYPK